MPTTKERADRVAMEFYGMAGGRRSTLAELVKRELDDAVAAERRECVRRAGIVDSHRADEIVDAFYARGGR